MALRNPYSAYGRTGDEDSVRREALLQALDDEPAPPGRGPSPIDRNRERPTGPDGFVDLTEDPNAEIARPYRTPARTPQQTREMLSGPGGRTQADFERETDPPFGSDTPSRPFQPSAPPPSTNPLTTGGNPFSGDRWQDERQGPGYSPTPAGDPGAQPGGATSFRSQPARGRELLDAYAENYERRGGYGGLEPTRRNISMGLLSSGEPFTMVSGAFGMLDAYMRRRAESAPTDLNVADAREIISQAHLDALGREIEPAYLDQIIRGQGWQPGDRYVGEASMAYILDQFYQHADAERAQRGPETAAAATPAAGATPAGATGPAPYAMEGFDLQRAQDPSFSVKDAFAAAVRQAPEPPPGENKAALGEWFKKYAQPFIEAQGHTVNWVDGDKVNITGPQGTGTTDWYRGAGAAGGALAWQPEGGGAGGGGGGAMGDAPGDIAGAYAYLKSIADPGMSRAEMESAITQAFGNVPGFERGYAGDVVIGGRKIDLITNFEGANPQWSDNLSFVPLHAGSSAGGAQGGAPSSGMNLAPGVQLAAPLGRSDVNQQIMEELQRIMSGAPPRDALLAELGGA